MGNPIIPPTFLSTTFFAAVPLCVSYRSTHRPLLPLEAFSRFRIAPASPLCCVLTTLTKLVIMLANLALTKCPVKNFFGFLGGAFCRRVRFPNRPCGIGDCRLRIEKSRIQESGFK